MSVVSKPPSPWYPVIVARVEPKTQSREKKIREADQREIVIILRLAGIDKQTIIKDES